METSTTNPSTTQSTSGSTSTSTTTTTDTGSSTSTSVDITPIVKNQEDLKILSSLECALLFGILVFLSLDKALGRFLKK